MCEHGREIMKERIVLRERWGIVVATSTVTPQGDDTTGLSIVGIENSYGRCLAFVRQHYWLLRDDPAPYDGDNGSVECAIRKTRVIAGPHNPKEGEIESDGDAYGWVCLVEADDGTWDYPMSERWGRSGAELDLAKLVKDPGYPASTMRVALVQEVIMRQGDS